MFLSINARFQYYSRRSIYITNCGSKDANALADLIDYMKQEMGLCMVLEDIGVTSDELLDALVSNSFAPNMQNNPVAITPGLLKEFHQSLVPASVTGKVYSKTTLLSKRS